MKQSGSQEIELLMKVAHLYYRENKTQADIASLVNTSRSQVSKLLTKAKEMNIVTFSIHHPGYDLQDISQEIIDHFKKFGLVDCHILRRLYVQGDAGEFIVDAASYVDRFIARSSVTGIGWGSLIHKISTQSLHQPFSTNNIILPLCGTVSSPNIGYNTNEIVRLASASFSLSPQYLYAPAFPFSMQEYKSFCDVDNYKVCAEYWSHMDVAVFKICNYPDSPDLATAYRFGDRLEKENCVGSFLGYYYNKDGKFIDGENALFIGAETEQIRTAAVRIGIVSSFTNINSLIGALHTGCISHLFIPEDVLMDLYKTFE